MSGEPEVLFAVDRGVGRITLNQPRILNALNFRMVKEIDPKLREWADDPNIREVLITGNGERAFCAGGDVRGLHEYSDDRDERLQNAFDFFRAEYVLNRLIKRYPKPYVALIDGITMGGGVGLSVHGTYRVATERTMFAMPEMAIGFFPDVGGGYVLAHCPDNLGRYFGLAGARAKAADSLKLGIATHYVADDRLADFEAAIGDEPIEILLDKFTSQPDDGRLDAVEDAIDRCFSGDSIEAFLDALDDEEGDWAAKAAAHMRHVSPTSLKVGLRQLNDAVGMSFEENMAMEYRLCRRFMAEHDFREGVRALLVDKDNEPKWQPSTLKEVDDATVDSYFAPLGDDELTFD